MSDDPLDIFLVVAPGLEQALAGEARDAGFAVHEVQHGGVTLRGGWPDVWRANLVLRGATRVLVRIAAFPVFHLAQLDKRARRVDWRAVLRADVPVRLEATCRKSKIYHAGAAAQRVERAIADELGAPAGKDDALTVKVRIEANFCTISVDTSGDSLHRRGFKTATGKAPMRETLAALFLREAGYRGSEPVLDPMCGSGTFPIEAAEIARGLAPGRCRSFAFERLATFDASAWEALRAGGAPQDTGLRFFGSDRDAGAITNANANAAAAGIGDLCHFTRAPVSELERPEGPPGLIMVNPPYGGRIGNRKLLFGLYGSLGKVLKARFSGWRVGLVTSDGGLASASELPFSAGPPVDHGGTRVKLYCTKALP